MKKRLWHSMVNRWVVLAFTFALCFPSVLQAQVVRTLPKWKPTGGSGPRALVQEKTQIIPQANLSISGAAPQMTVNILKFYVGISDNASIPLFILSSLPMSSDASRGKTVQGLLNEFGGLGNISLGLENTKLNLGKLFKFEDPNYGPFAEGRLGVKVIEFPELDTKEAKTEVLGQALLNFRLHLPISDTSDISNLKGNVNVLFSAAANYSGASRFQSFLELDQSKLFGYVNFSVAFNISDEISIQGGGTLTSSSDRADSRWYFSLNAIPN